MGVGRSNSSRPLIHEDTYEAQALSNWLALAWSRRRAYLVVTMMRGQSSARRP